MYVCNLSWPRMEVSHQCHSMAQSGQTHGLLGRCVQGAWMIIESDFIAFSVLNQATNLIGATNRIQTHDTYVCGTHARDLQLMKDSPLSSLLISFPLLSAQIVSFPLHSSPIQPTPLNSVPLLSSPCPLLSTPLSLSLFLSLQSPLDSPPFLSTLPPSTDLSSLSPFSLLLHKPQGPNLEASP